MMRARAAARSEAAGKTSWPGVSRGADIAAGDRVPAIERQQTEAKVPTTTALADQSD